jgi:hypothetical protein
MTDKQKPIGFKGSQHTPVIFKYSRNTKPYLFAWFDHVHSPDGYCVKNNFGPKCKKEK